MKITDDELKLDFKDVLIRPQYTDKIESRKDASLSQQLTFKYSPRTYHGIGLIAANMDGVGTPTMASAFHQYCSRKAVRGLSVALNKHYSPEATLDILSNTRQRGYSLSCVWFTLGMTDIDKEKLVYLRERWNKGWLVEESPLPYICLDVANGYNKKFVDTLKWVRDVCPDSVILAGAVCTPEMTEVILESGADIVKLGLGNGSVCTTRYKTGVGYPQLSALLECCAVADSLGGHICSDGGCTCVGDICKAYGAGASFVMVGGMFAGHYESEKDVIEEDGKIYVEFYGMSSKKAQENHGCFKEYRASEGKVVKVPYRGLVENTLDDILGGLRSACTYSNSSSLSEFRKNAVFIRSTIQTNNIFGQPS